MRIALEIIHFLSRFEKSKPQEDIYLDVPVWDKFNYSLYERIKVAKRLHKQLN